MASPTASFGVSTKAAPKATSNATPRLVIAGTHSGCGKTTVSIGLMAAFARDLSVQPFKVGPDYIDPMYHQFVTGKRSRNLDGWMLSPETIRHLFARNSSDAELAIVEGVMGLYDGVGINKDVASTSQIAKTIKAPVILVIDGGGMSTSAAAMARGYQGFDPGLQLEGVIFNRVSGMGHYNLLKEALESHTGLKAYGYLPKDLGLKLPSRHLGLIPSGEIEGLRARIDRLVAHLRDTVDLDGLQQLAARASKPLEVDPLPVWAIPVGRKVRIGVAYDDAFNFYYWDNLDLLEGLGAELVMFSPLVDQELPPALDGLYLGGGFPEVFAAELAENGGMLASIREALEGGLPYIAECGGLMYLVDEIEDLEGRPHPMVGWIPGQVKMTKRLQRFGYADLELQAGCVLGEPGARIRVHEFHRSEAKVQGLPQAFRLSKRRPGQEVREWGCSFIKGNGVAGYPHFHFYGNIDFARSFIEAAYTQKGDPR